MEPIFIIALFVIITDLSSSIFIIISVSLEGFRRTNVSPLNGILMSLSVSNVIYTIATSAYFLNSPLWSYFYSIQFVLYFLSFMTVYSITSTSWLTSVLCFFYFVKIIPSWPGLLQNIKDNIGAIVWRLILMVEIVSLGGGFLPILSSFQNENKRNSTINDENIKETNGQKLKLTNILPMLNSLSCIINVVTTVASNCFLRLYDCRMKKNDGTLVNSNVKDYRSAVHTMTGLLIFYLLVILAVALLALEVFADSSAEFWVCSMLLLSYPTGQSTLLIYSNPKLKEILRGKFSSLRRVRLSNT